MDDNGRFLCHLCDKSYKSEASLTVHVCEMSGHQTISCMFPGCEATFLNSEPKRVRHEQDKHQLFIYRCSICRKVIEGSEQWRKHKQIHYKLPCPECDLGYTDSGSLRRHRRKQHMSPPPVTATTSTLEAMTPLPMLHARPIVDDDGDALPNEWRLDVVRSASPMLNILSATKS
ncbi:hypothetical protein CPC16_010881 [Podila verticillata]|nr:hypothetical protein CPC16_010881 [Podila verticillata]